ncbi:MAG: hypothetical protein ACHQIK_01705 [Candidatus Acidiferrales bacterium]
MSNITGRDIFLIGLGVLQVGFACLALVYLVSVIIAGAAYLGIGPLALPVLLFGLWGVVSGLLLLFRRSIGACRAASTWYLPIGVLSFALAVLNLAGHPTWSARSFSSAFVFLLIFAVLAVPILPGYYPSSWPLSKSSGRDKFLVVLAVVQIGFAGFVLVDHVSRSLAGADLGINTRAPFVLMFDLWGVVSGVWLLFRRSVDTCRMAAIWYLPVGLFFFGFSARGPAWQPMNFSLPVTFLLIFVVLAVPLLPGYYPWSGRIEGVIK